MPDSNDPGALQRELDQPFPNAVKISKPVYEKGRKTGDVTAVPWHEYARKLNKIVPGHWGAVVSHLEVVGEKLLMTVDVTINGQTRSGTGSAKADKDSWGGAHAEAFSQAFRRGCAMHGVGLSMYRKEDARPMDPPTVERKADEDMKPTGTQKTRLAELAESGAFGQVEIENFKARLKKNFTKATAGKIIREMKGVYQERTGGDFVPPSES